MVPRSDAGWRADDPAIDALADFPSAKRRHDLQLGESEWSCFQCHGVSQYDRAGYHALIWVVKIFRVPPSLGMEFAVWQDLLIRRVQSAARAETAAES